MPDVDLPKFDDEALKTKLPDLCRGLRSLA
jgi:hypothetical protein